MSGHPSSPNDHESVHCRAVEKSSPHGDLGSTHATVSLIPIPNPAVQDGVFCCSVSGSNPPRRWTITPPDNAELRERLQGLGLPLVTPFRDGEIDEPSLRRL